MFYLFNVVSSFGTSFDEHNVQLFRFSIAFFGAHLPFVRKISFIAY